MRIVSIHIRNFGTVKKIDLDLDIPGFTRVVGINLDGGSDSNGVGKSTIFRALCWCFFGQIPGLPKRVGDSIVNPTVGKGCSVMTILKDDKTKQEIKIERARLVGEKKKDSFLLIEGLEETYQFDMRGKDQEESTEKVVEILGCDYEVFVQAYYYPQEGVIPFGFLTDKALKEFFLTKFLEIDWIEKAHALVVADKKKLDKELLLLTQEIEHQERSLNGMKEDLYAQKEYAQEFEDKQKDKIKIQKEAVKGQEVYCKKLQDDSKRYQNEIESLGKEKLRLSEAVSAATRDFDELKLDLRSNAAKAERIEERIKSAKAKLRQIVADMGGSDKAGFICPVCKQPLKGKEAKEEIRKRFLSEKEEYEKEISWWEPRLEEVNKLIQETEKKIARGLPKKTQDLEKKQKEVNEQYEDVVRKAPRQEEVRRADMQLLNLKERLKSLKDEVNPFIKITKDLEVKIEKSSKDLESKHGEYKTAEGRQEAINFWSVGFSPAGIQNHLLESITPLINDRIERYLSVLSDGHLKAEFETIERLKSGEFREKFKLKAYNKLGASEYAHLSGGEKARINIATSLALGDLKRIQSSKSLNLLILDEIFTGLDESGKSDVLELISLAYPDMCVYVVAHEDLNHQMFTREIVVQKKNGVTTLKGETR